MSKEIWERWQELGTKIQRHLGVYVQNELPAGEPVPSEDVQEFVEQAYKIKAEYDKLYLDTLVFMVNPAKRN